MSDPQQQQQQQQPALPQPLEDAIKKTIDLMSRIIKKPPLNAKLLSKPPFKYLHDMFSELIRVTADGGGFAKGLYTEETLFTASGSPVGAPSTTGSEYWTISTGVAIRTGFSCRECKAVIGTGEPVVVRDGRKMRFFYHRDCYAGDPDPRTQPSSSFHQRRYENKIQKEAPKVKGRGKWSVQQYGYNDAVAAWK